MTTLITQPLRDEHKELLPHIEQIRTVGDSIDEVSTEVLKQNIESVYEFLTYHLIPHAQAEDAALYPIVAKVMGAPETTATMRRDHVEVGALTNELGQLRAQLNNTLNTKQMKSLRRVLYGLYALVKVHFAKEEEVYLPLLEARLSKTEAQEMFKAMEAAAHEAKHALA